MIPFLLCIGLGLAQAPVQPAPQPVTVEGKGSPTFTVPRIEEQVVIDGRLDEPAWKAAARLTGFWEYRPTDSRLASEQTEILIWYSPSALHIGVLAYDAEPGSVRATVADRDNLDNEDTIRIYLDTFNDRRRAFVFGVNPLGSQLDGVQSEGEYGAGHMRGMMDTADLSPDYQFDSKGRLTPEGYTVEIRIPFKSLRYPSSPGMKWGINFERKIQRTGRQDTWTDAKRVASFLAQSATMEGLHDLRRGVVTEIQPFITASANGALDDNNSFSRESIDPSAGVNVRLGFTNISLDATVNPDFSQVESDASQVTANERFALYYEEKRPFFLEGIELFSTPSKLIYTRRMADPVMGGKVTGKIGKTGIALLTAVDDEGDDNALVNIARLRRDIGADSVGGITYTDRTSDGAFNRVLAADARIVFKKLYFVLAQAGGSWTQTEGGTTLSSPMFHAEYDRTGHYWGFNYKLEGYGKDFEAQSGYVPRNNMVQFTASNRAAWYGKRGSLLETVSVFVSPERIWNYSDFGKNGAIEGGESAHFSAQLRGGWVLGGELERSFYNFEASSFSTMAVVNSDGSSSSYVPLDEVTGWGTSLSVTSPAFQRMNGSFELDHGGVAIYDEGSKGTSTEVSASLNLRPTPSIRIANSLSVARITRDSDGEEFARTIIPRVKLEYQPRRSLFFRMITEYEFENDAALRDPISGQRVMVDGALSEAGRTRDLRMDWLVSFEPTPGTVAFFGYGSSLARNRDLYHTSSFRKTSDGFFVKLAYMFRR
jgi:hypothetical protein